MLCSKNKCTPDRYINGVVEVINLPEQIDKTDVFSIENLNNCLNDWR